MSSFGGFGSSNTTNANNNGNANNGSSFFGSSNMNTNNNPQSTGFGAAAALSSSSSPFVSPPQQQPVSNGFGTSASMMTTFGSPAAVAVTAPSMQPQPFGSQQQPSAFGGHTMATTTTNHFQGAPMANNTNVNAPFGSQPQQQSQQQPSSGFGMSVNHTNITPSAAPTTSFGMSNTLAMAPFASTPSASATISSMTAFGTSMTMAPGPSSTYTSNNMGAAGAGVSPFGMPSNSSSGFSGATGGTPAPGSSAPFGTNPNSGTAGIMSPFGTSSGTTAAAGGGGGMMSTDSLTSGFGMSSSNMQGMGMGMGMSDDTSPFPSSSGGSGTGNGGGGGFVNATWSRSNSSTGMLDASTQDQQQQQEAQDQVQQESQLEQKKERQAKLQSEIEVKRAKLKAKLAAAKNKKKNMTAIATANNGSSADGGNGADGGGHGPSRSGSMAGGGGLNPRATSFTPQSPKRSDASASTRSKSPKRSEAKSSSSSQSNPMQNDSFQIPKKKRQQRRSGMIPPPPPSLQPSQGDQANANSELAVKNAQRFATNQDRSSISFLPRDLQVRARTGNGAANNNNTTTTNEVPDDETSATGMNRTTAAASSSKPSSLVGTCPHMCPDEELLRRESENDVQLLELPHESIHPKDWTLRNTAVKRFKRSAADFKLDIPGLVRPPPVLERVCAYLEEWVMERDRQGKDPRFDGSVPPPLDVYQFIWDRTRMVRKDFILQNFIGQNGKCNATAVRCHERIARWHALCEHQLSHIPEYVTMQSQQNIQELGQTMKTLNQFYDDPEARATREDDNVSRNAHNLHGCQSHINHGANPVDYNGSTIINNDSANNTSKRIIGSKNINNGTAEPEMRGLYILLTLDNDGGMEVLKYAARLSVENKAVFKSRPVQLALEVYKVRKEYNYARFFSILRSPSTPYLFACIMFKYVENMRKAALRIMSRTFGAKRTNGEAINDEYPLSDLVRLLCYEDLEEARAACENYSITIKRVLISEGSDGAVDCIFWKHSSFSERKDPIKGSIISLNPKKMLRTIEIKHGGASRLAICRGEVSGEGSTLDGSLSVPKPPVDLGAIRRKRKAVEEAKKRAAAEGEKARLIAKKRKEEEIIRAEEEKIRLEKLEAAEITKRKIALIKEEQRERAIAAQQRLEAEKRAKEEAVKLQKIKEEEARRKAKEEDEARIRAALEAEIEMRRQAEIARLEELRIQVEERMKEEEEMERQRFLKIQREREKEQERIRVAKEDEERRIEQEWQLKIDYAKKVVLLRKWQAALISQYDGKKGAKKTLDSLDPTRTSLSISLFRDACQMNRYEDSNVSQNIHSKTVSYQHIFYRLGSDQRSEINVANTFLSLLNKSSLHKSLLEGIWGSSQRRKVALIKIGIIVVPGQAQGDDMKKFIDMWVDSRLKYRSIHCSDEGNDVQIRVTVIDCKTIEDLRCCDAALMIVPPNIECDEFPDMSIPGYILNFSGDMCATELMKKADKELHQGCEKLFSAMIDSQRGQNGCTLFKMMESVSLKHLCCSMLKRVVSTFEGNLHREFLSPHLKRYVSDDIATQIVTVCHDVLVSFLNRVDDMRGNFSHMPSDEFFDPVKDEITNYFWDGQGLPRNWRDMLGRDELEYKVWHLFPCFRSVLPLAQVLDCLLSNAPLHIRRENGLLLQQRKMRQCLEQALNWVDYVDEKDSSIFFPFGDVGTILDSVVESCEDQTGAVIHLEIPALVHQNALSITKIKELPDSPETSMQTRSAKRTSDFKSLTTKRSKTESMAAEHSLMNRRDREGQKVIARLKALRDGNSMFDIDIGNTSLSNILSIQRNDHTFPQN